MVIVTLFYVLTNFVVLAAVNWTVLQTDITPLCYGWERRPDRTRRRSHSLAVPCSESEHLFRFLGLMNPARRRPHDCPTQSRLKAYSRSSSVVSTLGSAPPITQSSHSLSSRLSRRWSAVLPNSSCSQRSISRLSILSQVLRFSRCGSKRSTRQVNALTLSGLLARSFLLRASS